MRSSSSSGTYILPIEYEESEGGLLQCDSLGAPLPIKVRSGGTKKYISPELFPCKQRKACSISSVGERF